MFYCLGSEFCFLAKMIGSPLVVNAIARRQRNGLRRSALKLQRKAPTTTVKPRLVWPVLTHLALRPQPTLTADKVCKGSPARGGDIPSLPTPFYSVLESLSVFMALLPVFHSINSLDESPFSHPVLPVSFLPYWCSQLYASLRSLL